MGPEWRRVLAALDAAGRDLPEKLRNEVADVTRPLVKEAQGKVMNFPVKGTGHTGLRARVAAGVGTKVLKSGVQIYASMNKKNEKGIPLGMDSAAGWRHPVYGNRHAWVVQHTGGDWFQHTFEDGRPRFESGLDRVLRDAADTVDREGGR